MDSHIHILYSQIVRLFRLKFAYNILEIKFLGANETNFRFLEKLPQHLQ